MGTWCPTFSVLSCFGHQIVAWTRAGMFCWIEWGKNLGVSHFVHVARGKSQADCLSCSLQGVNNPSGSAIRGWAQEETVSTPSSAPRPHTSLFLLWENELGHWPDGAWRLSAAQVAPPQLPYCRLQLPLSQKLPTSSPLHPVCRARHGLQISSSFRGPQRAEHSPISF